MVRIRMEPQDEYMHALESASNFNESMYFNVYDPQRAGRRLPPPRQPGQRGLRRADHVPRTSPTAGSRSCSSAPRSRTTTRSMPAAPSFEVITPFEELRTTYDGKVVMLDEPLQMADPAQRVHRQPVGRVPHRPHTPRRVTDVRRRAGERRRHAAHAGLLRRLRARPLRAAHGGHRDTIRIGDEEWAVKGNGLRDHSWGPRFWQAPWYYRWLTANFGDDFGFVVSIVTAQDGKARIGGMVLRDGEYEHIHSATPRHRPGRATTSYHHRSARPRPPTSDTYEISGKVLNLIPLRNRRTTPEGEQPRHAHLRGHDRMVLRGQDRLRPLRVPRPDRSTARPSAHSARGPLGPRLGRRTNVRR